MRQWAKIGAAGALAAMLALPGCAPDAQSQTTADYPARVALHAAAAPAPTPPQSLAAVHRKTVNDDVQQPAGATWRVADTGRSIAFGAAGARPLLTLTCSVDSAGAARLTVVRNAPADPGAKALFALIGARQVSRIKVDAAAPQGGHAAWEGSAPAADAAWTVFTPGSTIVATVPGGGAIRLAADAEPGRLVERCRQADTATGAPRPA